MLVEFAGAKPMNYLEAQRLKETARNYFIFGCEPDYHGK